MCIYYFYPCLGPPVYPNLILIQALCVYYFNPCLGPLCILLLSLSRPPEYTTLTLV